MPELAFAAYDEELGNGLGVETFGQWAFVVLTEGGDGGGGAAEAGSGGVWAWAER